MFQNKALSALGGLLFFENLLTSTRLEERAVDCLPRLRIASRASSFDKFRALMLGLVSGADCLDDMDALAEDPRFAG
ncbi:hypothetical protein [Oligoflexus tunisiensis]|uniref:hypothetical protein n=1 Tax=Oligoflexus tunisiensis TaxID=708132 RepID=UPI001C407B0F|nr:hypothetical protein [Oligoflexus tunisiensis]